MKLIIAILRDSDNEPVSQALIASSFRVTRIASTGGFLRRGSSTIMVGVDDGKVDEAINVIRASAAPPVELGVKRATLFVLDVQNFTQV
ncbi:MAG TPA: cyclic-di-AMP receptor [Anaerolineales bacterium]